MTRPAITCVAPFFPTPWFPESGVFLKNLADVMSDEGLDVQVVAPLSLGRRLRAPRQPDQTAAAIEHAAIVRPRSSPCRKVVDLNRHAALNERLPGMP